MKRSWDAAADEADAVAAVVPFRAENTAPAFVAFVAEVTMIFPLVVSR
jgi:hypothetical protein